MPVVEYAGQSIEVNEEGFLMDSSQWTPEVAEAIAKQIGIDELNDQHWKVITFCREDAAKQGTPPGLRRISKNSGVNMKDLYQLFPKGPGKLAAMVSGLPKPQGCI
jgi:TusE/DsrC/DsvC family sulfur relay protein